MKVQSILLALAVSATVNGTVAAAPESQMPASIPVNLVKEINDTAQKQQADVASISRVSVETFNKRTQELANFEKETIAAINATTNLKDKAALRENFWKRQEELINGILTDLADSEKRLNTGGGAVVDTLGNMGKLKEIVARAADQKEESAKLKAEILTFQKDAKLLQDQYSRIDRTSPEFRDVREKRQRAIQDLRRAVMRSKRLKQVQPMYEQIAARISSRIGQLTTLQQYADDMAVQYSILADDYRAKLAQIQDLKVLNEVGASVTDLTELAKTANELGKLTSGIVALGTSESFLGDIPKVDELPEPAVGGTVEELLSYQP